LRTFCRPTENRRRSAGENARSQLGTSRTSLYAAFVVSGIAGLVYEVLWTRYLGLYVGHSAYAQVLVLGVYLGGMAVGAFVLADLSKRVANPIAWYAAAECLLALFGLVFHPIFVAVTDLSYDRIFPALASAGVVGSTRWAIAGLLILPQAMILGATFPLMGAALVRADPTRPGQAVARAYLWNTLGGAAGVLLAGFWMIGVFGLPGTSVAAAVLNLIAAGAAVRVHLGLKSRVPHGTGPPPIDPGDAEPYPTPAWAEQPRALVWLLLAVSFGSALASFAYEIGWIRMLSLVLGSATHSFELMLSAFILGLGIGAWWIGGRADRTQDPFGLLGRIQVLMGVAALASLPLFYFLSFDVMSWLVRELPGRTAGYALFNVARYGLSLAVMLPATVLAGMTLPLITGTLLRASMGERAIGRVYGINTVGSVVGAGVAGLIALPWLGLKGLILAGAALDVVLGLVLLERSARWAKGQLRFAGFAALASAAAFAAVGLGVRFDDIVMSSGVYRYGIVPAEGERLGLFYSDGGTATVSAHLGDGMVALSTNGKPDASLDAWWLTTGRDTMPERPIARGRDVTTQALAPAVALAHAPAARVVANIGHGSGMSATAFLASNTLERVITIEIEPIMLEGSVVFLPFNEPAFSDPRSSYVFDDAKSYFAYHREPFDIVFAEPSNPWVSGTASLFTVEFYTRIRQFLARGGVLAQWMQIYELNDELFLSVIAAIDTVFPSYKAYLVGDRDVAIVARADGPLAEPDWSVLGSEGLRGLLAGAPPFMPEHMEALFLFDESTFRPLIERGVRPNSDYRPVLDLGAERARFDQTTAEGVYSFATSRVDLVRLLIDAPMGPVPYSAIPAYGLAPAVSWGRAAWLRSVNAAGGGISPEEFPEWQNALVDLQTFLSITRAEEQTTSWEAWAGGFDQVEGDLHWGTIGWVDTTFYREVYDFLDRAEAPPVARAAVDLHHALDLLDWDRVASAADQLVSRVAIGERWVDPGTLLDAAVIAYLRVGRPAAARTTLDTLGPRTGRRRGNLRDQLLDALVVRAETGTRGP
jgi:predicted membrane-bound spermidine synthase